MEKTINKTGSFKALNINLSEVDDKGNTLLHRAAAKGDLNKLGYLMTHHAHLREIKNKFGSTSVHYATWQGQLESVKYLVEHGVDLNTKDNYDQTLLHAAAWNGYLNLVKYFRRKGLSFEDKDQNGNTSLLSAAKNNHLPVVKWLISENADTDVKDNNGNNILFIAAENGDIGIIDFLVRNTKIGDLSVFRDRDNNTLLHIACANGHIELVKYLLYFHQGFSLEAKNDHEETPLHSAVYTNNIKLVNYLLEQGADINAKNDEGETPVVIAAHDENEELVKSLLQHGAHLEPDHMDNIRVHEVHLDKPEQLEQYVVKQKDDLSADLSEPNANQRKAKHHQKMSQPAFKLHENTSVNDSFNMQGLNDSLPFLGNTTGFFQNHSQAAQGELSAFNSNSISEMDGGMDNSTSALLLAQALFKKPGKNKNTYTNKNERYEQEERIIEGLNTFDANNLTTNRP
ncbi:ankyrin repeat domain-containing protein [Rickettsiella grylli]|uniref:ankyrin repeat domain-containing protein n=1 Tax=Rickettsiella grylli TaxID=59196 RepID=UPI000ADE7271|nr:ankyrin repeat domain-containing protein [Rickettsiella grylli]